MPLGLTTVSEGKSCHADASAHAHHVIGSSSCSAAMRWEAELDSCTRMLYEAELADGNTCTPTLTLFFEDQAFAKLAYDDARVRRACTRQQQLVSLHNTDLAGIDFAGGSGDFQPFLADFVLALSADVKHKVLTMKGDAKAKAVNYAHLQAVMPSMAERGVVHAKTVRA